MSHAVRRPTPVVSRIRACSDCGQMETCFLASALPDESGDCASVVYRRKAVSHGERLFDRGAPFSALYLVAKGSIKTQRVTPEGDLVVTGFFLPGDVVGLDALGDDRYPSDAVVLTDSEVCRLQFQRLFALCSAKPRMHDWILSRIGWYLRHKENNLSWSRGLSSDLRVLQFFLDLHERLRQTETSRSTTTLPMKKQDIAHYLHITPETLSRNLAVLRKSGLLLIDNDRFTLPDPARARQMTSR